MRSKPKGASLGSSDIGSEREPAGRAFGPIQAFYLSIPTDPSCAAANLRRVPVADASPGMLK